MRRGEVQRRGRGLIKGFHSRSSDAWDLRETDVACGCGCAQGRLHVHAGVAPPRLLLLLLSTNRKLELLTIAAMLCGVFDRLAA